MGLNNSILLSRTDSLGDVILSLPMAGVIKKQYPKIKIYFLAKNYAKAIIEASDNIDEFVSFDDLEKLDKKNQIDLFKNLAIDAIIHVFPNKLVAKLAKSAGVPIRVGTSHRFFHWYTCNSFIQLGRRKSPLHEAQLNLELLKSLQININYPLAELYKFYGFTNIKPLPSNLTDVLSEKRKNIIIHPKSKGSAREWGLDNFSKLINILPEKEYKIFVTGTKLEAELMADFLVENNDRITNLTGEMSLDELVSFISKSDALVAASTGPLHIAAATGIKAVGIFAPMRPIHPGRWMPLGKRATYIVQEEYCDDCRKSTECKCILDISPKQVYDKLME